MSNKRAAVSDLNQDNWNEEEEPEEMGTYRSAPSSTLKARPMKRAKRRGITGDNDGPSVFKNFKGFGTTDSSATPSFSFLNNDGEKPKLSFGGSFPSFSFSKTKESDKTDESKSVPLNSSGSGDKATSLLASILPTTLKNNTDKGENESSTTPLLKFGATDKNTNKNDSVESSPQSAFSFGVTTSNKSADKSLSSSFSFNSSKKEGESETYKPIFKFGLVDTNKNTTNSIESSPKSTFVFGVPTSNKTEDRAVLSTFNFNPSKTTGDAPPVFKFGVNASADTKVNNNSSSPVTTQQSKLSSDNTNNENSSNSLKNQNKEPQSSKVNGITETPKTEKRKRSTLFLANLKALNLGVIKWVQQHLDKNQYINLIPIFEDYKTHFEDIKKKFDNDDSQSTKSNKNISSNQEKASTLTPKNSSCSDSLFSFGSSSTSESKADAFPTGLTTTTEVTFEKSSEKEKTLSEQKPFTFGLIKTVSENPKNTTTEFANKPSGTFFNFGKSNSNPAFSFGSDQSKLTFNFGSTDSSSSSKTDFSFGLSKDAKTTGFSFATTAAATESRPEESKDDENEVQEEEQMPEIKEDGAVYEKKAKLFHKKKNQYNTIGVGTLYIKPVKENEKSQLIVRADNSLGTVLLNILLNESIPTQRVGKNNVLIICVPNPPLEGTQTPASILIRVKTGNDADELFEKLNHYKKLHKSEDDTGKDSN